MNRRWIFVVVLLACWTVGRLAAVEPAAVSANIAARQVPYEPAPKIRDGQVDPRFLTAHASFLKRIQAGPIGVLLVGDSITAGWTATRERRVVATGGAKRAMPLIRYGPRPALGQNSAKLFS